MTYKAGDKVVTSTDNLRTVESINELGNLILNGYRGTRGILPHTVRPATPVEIAKQAVLDEVNDRGDSVSPILNELLDVLISKVQVETAIDTLERLKRLAIERTLLVPEYKTGWIEQKQQTAVVGEKDGVERIVNNPAYGEHKITRETFERSLTNNLNEYLTPPVIGDETKLD